MRIILYFSILAVALVALEVVYRRVVLKWVPRLRVDNHSTARRRGQSTVTGGGFIFFLAAAACPLCGVGVPLGYWWMLAGLFAMWIVSFIDDIYDISPLLRLGVQFVASAAACVPVWAASGPLWWVAAATGCVIMLNSYNFMDGISGMLSFYSIATLCSLAMIIFATPAMGGVSELILPVSLLLATLVFSWFNVVRTDMVFSGDVGSIVMGMAIGWILVNIIAVTGNWCYLVLVSVYLVDTILTILYRLVRGENILLSHHYHLYQRLARRSRVGHHPIALLYASVQVVINSLLFFLPRPWQGVYVAVVVTTLIALWIIVSVILRRSR